MAGEIYNEVTNRLHSVRESEDPKTNHITTGADEVYDDVAPYRINGHIRCNTVTPVGTENPKEFKWYEQVTYDSGQDAITEWVRSNDTTVDVQKTYGIPAGAKQSDINDQLYKMTGDTDKVVLYANEYEQVSNPPAGANPQANGWYELSGSTYILTTDTTVVSGKTYYARVAHISPDENKIINQQDGYIPTAGAVGRAIGGNFEDNLQSTSTVKGLTANMGRVLNENKADINGYYETISVGSAKHLDGKTINSEEYLIKPTGGENNEVVSGLASVLGMEGNSCVWNQLVRNGDFSNGTTGWTAKYGSITTSNNVLTYTVATPSGSECLIQNYFKKSTRHRFLFSCELNYSVVPNVNNIFFGVAGYWGLFNRSVSQANVWTKLQGIVVDSGDAPNAELRFYFRTQNMSAGDTVKVRNVKVFDLTQMFGADYEPSTVAKFEAWLAQHVGTKHYYVYNAGTILSAQTRGIKTYGQNLLNPTTKQAKLIPYTWVENGTTYSNKYTIKNVPSGATATFTPDATGVAETVDISGGSLDITSYGSGILELSAATADTYVCMKWNGDKDNDVVPYEDHTYDFDVRNVYGKVSGAGEYVQCFQNGMRSAGTVKDSLTASEAVVKIGEVDMGTLSYSNLTTNLYSCNLSIPRAATTNTQFNAIVSKKYIIGLQSNWSSVDYQISRNNNVSGGILVKDKDFPSSATNLKTSLAGIMIDYELETPITYTDLIYRDGGVDRPLREVLVNINIDNWSMEEQLMTDYDNQGNPTSVSATIQTKYSIDAVEAIKTLKETSYFESDIHDNLQAMLTCINTNCASVLGGQFSISETATNKLFNFTFTANASTNSTEENTETI